MRGVCLLKQLKSMRPNCGINMMQSSIVSHATHPTVNDVCKAIDGLHMHYCSKPHYYVDRHFYDKLTKALHKLNQMHQSMGSGLGYKNSGLYKL